MKAIRIYRHPDCPRCARIARIHHRFDWLDRVEDTTTTPPNGKLRIGQIVVEDLRSGRLNGGAEAVEAIFRQSPLYWPVLPLLKIPALRRRAADDANGQGANTCSPEPT